MMVGLRAFVVNITATALICALVMRLTHGSGTVKLVMKLLCGMVLAVSLLKPINALEFADIEQYMARFQFQADQAVQWGEDSASLTWRESISQGVETYILEKAKTLKVDLDVEVELSEEEVPIPVGVSLVGKISPYAKSVLSDTISQDLNIPKEKQIWIS